MQCFSLGTSNHSQGLLHKLQEYFHDFLWKSERDMVDWSENRRASGDARNVISDYMAERAMNEAAATRDEEIQSASILSADK